MKNSKKELLDYTKQQLMSVIFHNEYRTEPRYFTRKSILGFLNTGLLIMNMIKKSIKVELMSYFYQVDKDAKIPSRQAFSQAREKISYRAFKDFFDKSCELAVNSDDARCYKGYRVFAVDGTSFVVGMLRKLSEYFGESTTVKDKAMCRISAVVDVMNECIVNAVVSPFSTGERALAVGQIEALKAISNALLLFDRGYWSAELVGAIIGNGQKFLISVLQDIYSTLYISNLVAFICFESDEAIKERTAGSGNQYAQKTNRSTCISTLRKRFVDICMLTDASMRDTALQRLCDDISRDVVYVNKSKSRPRNKRLIKESRRHSTSSVL